MNAKGSITIPATPLVIGTLRNRVPMPAASTDQGNIGDYAVEGDTLAIYVADLGLGSPGWIFWTGFQR